MWETYWLKVRRIQLYVSHIHKKKIRIQQNKVSAAQDKMNSAKKCCRTHICRRIHFLDGSMLGKQMSTHRFNSSSTLQIGRTHIFADVFILFVEEFMAKS